MNILRKFLFLILLTLLPQLCIAGGDHFIIKVLDFKDKGNNEYRMHFIQLSQPYGEAHKTDEELIVHFRHKSKHNTLNDSSYTKSIEQLKFQIDKSKYINFGIVGSGYKKIPGTKNEYQSNGLEVHKGIVYSYKD